VSKAGRRNKSPKVTAVVPTSRNGRMSAAKQIGLETLPFDNTLSVVFREIRGGFASTIDFARIASETDPRFAKLVALWDDLSHTARKRLHAEDLCKAAEILPEDYLSEVTRLMFRVNIDAANLIAAAAHPKVIKRAVIEAQRPEGIQDRRFLMQHSGFLPLPNGTVINVQQVNQPEPVPSSVLPSFEESVKRNIQVIRGDAGEDSEGNT